MEMKTVGLVYGFFGSKLVAVSIFFFIIYLVDWKVQYEEFKKASEVIDLEISRYSEDDQVVVDMKEITESEVKEGGEDAQDEQNQALAKEKTGGNKEKDLEAEELKDLSSELLTNLNDEKV